MASPNVNSMITPNFNTATPNFNTATPNFSSKQESNELDSLKKLGKFGLRREDRKLKL